LRWSACRGVILDFVEPVLQALRISVKLYRDLAEGVDSSGTLRFLIMEPTALLFAAEVERHRVAGRNC
jgi:hypothetical protein